MMVDCKEPGGRGQKGAEGGRRGQKGADGGAEGAGRGRKCGKGACKDGKECSFGRHNLECYYRMGV